MSILVFIFTDGGVYETREFTFGELPDTGAIGRGIGSVDPNSRPLAGSEGRSATAKNRQAHYLQPGEGAALVRAARTNG